MIMTALPRHGEIRAHVLRPLGLPEETHAAAVSQHDTALREAYEKGLADGRTQTEETLQNAARALGEALAAFQREYRASAENLKKDTLRLAIAVARQVVLSEIKTRPEAIAEVVAHLIEEAENRKVSIVRLNPQDADRLRATPVARVMEEEGIEIQTSEDIQPGGCVLETGFGKLDARVETRLEEIAAALTGRRETVTVPSQTEVSA